ncbi:beta-phosphoglucomutase [Erythrobacter mangrovi]|uniref:Beta-phosphoglucomutase n=1 Tax=Erythrobacter mangrovi TaxID=2739433 RepID=A0A7D3XCR5_9SPHN|nr:beta-phosphoglucomutase [Erythrobacter mangrovi]QKG72590.1 beta-phosphoglucomutase [Erythrobacter mangrovi]
MGDARIHSMAEDGWQLEQTAYESEQEPALATLFALANGTIGVRGGLDELPGENAAVLADGHISNPISYHERFTGFASQSDMRFLAPSPVQIELLVDDAPLTLTRDAMLAFARHLDLRTGVLRRTTTWRVDAQRTLHITSSRIVAPGAGAYCASRIEACLSGGSGKLEIRFPLDCAPDLSTDPDDPRLNKAAPLQRERVSDDALQASFLAGRGEAALPLAMAQSLIVRDSAGDVLALNGCAAVRFELVEGAAVQVERHVAYALGQDAANGAQALLESNRAAGWDVLSARLERELTELWASCDLTIDGEEALAHAIRFSLFHLYQGGSRSDRHSIAAKGLSGEGYEGHYFWDTEVFVLPVLALTQPHLAAHILRYRIGALEKARHNARQIGHAKGALYPWRTIGGDECSAHYPTGTAQYHINADIAYALKVYRDATGDEALVREAAAMLFETARVWMEIGHFNSRRGGAFTIHGVTGPDEYTCLVDNDYYTNAMARRHLAFAATLAQELADDSPAYYAALTEEIGLAHDEVVQWRTAADKMWLPVDADLGIHPQDDSFLDKPELPFAELPRERFPLLLHHHPLLLFRHKLCKQGDVVQALSLIGEDVPLATKQRDLAYYGPLTTHDSTLSSTAFGILAAETGDDEQALHFHRETAFVDLENRHNNTHHGAHMAAMAGSWLTLVMGWGGLKLASGELHFHPRCPNAWTSYSFRLRWRGSLIEAVIDADGARYRLCDGPAATLLDHGRNVELTAEFTSVPPPQVEAVIFDLDGVLTDTAEAHFQAWKRLCDELDLPFDRKLNQQLKGVDRAGSLAIILAAAGVEASTDERAAMMARKNEFYRDAIAHYSPDDLFPGARECLLSCLAAGLRIGLASASRNARDVVRALGIETLFDSITNAAEVTNGKPDPEIFLTTARALGCDPTRCVGVEDASAGIAAIKGAGMRAIGIGAKDELSTADRVVPDIASLNLDLLVDPTTNEIPSPSQ